MSGMRFSLIIAGIALVAVFLPQVLYAILYYIGFTVGFAYGLATTLIA